jgi:flagellar hook assembly protein FlgD
MSTVKERIAQDLAQVKEKGNARTQKIREIVQVAVTDAVNEIKDGSGEIRTIAQEAVTTVIENFKSKGQQAKDEMMAAMEGAVAGVSDNHNHQQQTANSETINEQQVLEAVDGALVAVVLCLYF